MGGEKYTAFVGVRLTDTEQDLLRKKSRENNCTLSQAARLLMFKNKNVNNDPDPQQSSRQLLRDIKEQFKKLVASYKSVTSILDDSQRVLSDYHKRAIDSLVGETVLLQNSLNNVLKASGESEIHLIAKEKPHKPEKKRKTNVLYMEKLEIIGFIKGQPTEYTDKNGIKKLKFKVSVMRHKKEMLYFVYIKAVNLVPLNDGDHVNVSGIFDEDNEGKKLIYAELCSVL